jgi:hypothetical protein
MTRAYRSHPTSIARAAGDGPEYTGTVTVSGPDVYGLDSDNDGVGCE